MSGRRVPLPGACRAPMMYQLVPAETGGYRINVAHFCPTVPPCASYITWGPWADLDDAEAVRRLTWPGAIPGEPEVFRALRG